MMSSRFTIKYISSVPLKPNTVTTTAGRIKRLEPGMKIGIPNNKMSLHVKNETEKTYIKLVKVNKHKFIKSVLYQKHSTLILEKIKKEKKRTETKKEERDFVLLAKKSLFFNPLNIAIYFNIICFYEHKGRFKDVFFYSYILHNVLKKVLSKYFYQAKYYNKKSNGLRNLESIIYRKKENYKYETEIVKKIKKCWKNVPCKSDEMLIYIFLENFHFLCLSSYHCGLYSKLITYANICLRLLKDKMWTNRNNGMGIYYIKGEYFLLSTMLYCAKALCFFLSNSKKNMIEIKCSGKMELEKENEKQNVRSIIILEEEKIINMLNNYKEQVLKEEHLNGNIYKKKCLKVCINNILSYEQEFLSNMLNEKETHNEIEKMNNLNNFEVFFRPMDIRLILYQMSECIQFCLYNRLYKFIEEFLIWRSRIFFHLQYFHLCLSDTSKVLLLNIFSEANLNTKEKLYNCFLLRLASLKELNMLSYIDLCLFRIFNEVENNKGDTINCELTRYINKQEKEKEKNECINMRNHSYPWNRSYEYQYLLHILTNNKKKVPYTF